MTDYNRTLASEMLAFIKETEAFYPADLDPHDIHALRNAYDKMAAHFHAGRPPGMTVRDDRIAGVPVRIYADFEDSVILYVHGGGFILGGLDSHDDICAQMADRTGCGVVSVDYRLAPEHQHPAAYDDVLAVAAALRGHSKVILCGDSAGATLCAAVAGTRPDLQFTGQVLIYPMTGYPRSGGSFVTHAHAPLLTVHDLEAYAGAVGGDPADPRLSPARGQLDALPPTRIFAAECDPLCDDALRYAQDAGAAAQLVIHYGTVHGWLRARDCNADTRRAFDQIIFALNTLIVLD